MQKDRLRCLKNPIRSNKTIRRNNKFCIQKPQASSFDEKKNHKRNQKINLKSNGKSYF